MANITEYNNTIDKLQPSETGVEATAAAARRSGEFVRQAGASTRQLGQETAQEGSELQQFGREYAQAGSRFGAEFGTAVKEAGDSAVAYMDQKEISQGSTAASAFVLKNTQDWNTAVSGVKNQDGSWKQKPIDPDDPTAAQGFIQNMNTQLDDLVNSVHTEKARDHMTAVADQIKMQFGRTVTADMSTLAAAKAHEHAVTTVTNYSNAAGQNPAGVEGYAKLAADSIGAAYDSHPVLKGAEGVKERTNLVQNSTKQIYQTGAIAAIQKSNDPEATAAAWIKKYPEYINGAEALALAKTAKGQIKYNAMLDRAAETQKKTEQKDDYNSKAAGLVGSLINPDGTMRPAGPEDLKDAKTLLSHPGATQGEAMSMFKFVQGEQAVRQSDPEVRSSFYSDLRDGVLDPSKLFDAANAGKMSRGDVNELLSDKKMLEQAPIATKQFTTAMAAAKDKMIIPTNYSDFEQEMTKAYIHATPEERKNALNFEDDHSLINMVMNNHMPDPADQQNYKILHSIGAYQQQTTAQPKAPPSVPVGTVQEGKGGTKYKFKGGNTNDKNNWELL